MQATPAAERTWWCCSAGGENRLVVEMLAGDFEDVHPVPAYDRGLTWAQVHLVPQNFQKQWRAWCRPAPRGTHVQEPGTCHSGALNCSFPSHISVCQSFATRRPLNSVDLKFKETTVGDQVERTQHTPGHHEALTSVVWSDHPFSCLGCKVPKGK